MSIEIATALPFGLSDDQVQLTNKFYIQFAPCPPVHYKRNGEKVCNCNPCVSCGQCLGGHQ